MNEADRKLLDAFQDRIKQVEGHIITMNREMGVIMGKLGVLVWLIRGVIVIALGQLIVQLFFS